MNGLTNMDVFPLPHVDDTLDMLSQTQYFSMLDLAAGYWQVRMDRDSQEKTAFTEAHALDTMSFILWYLGSVMVHLHFID